MKKIFFISLIIVSQLLLAQTIEVDSYVDKNKIGISDLLKFTLEISGEDVGNISTPGLPEIKNFENLGSSTSSSSSYSFVNGKMNSKVTKSYKYTLRPLNTGNYLIPPITIKLKQQTFTTDPVHITVIKGSTHPAPPTSPNFSRQSNASVDLSDNLFMITDISKTSAYEGEPLIVEYKLYSRYDIANLAFAGDTNFEGFWKEDIFLPESISFKRETYKGVMYNKMLMRSVALFPTKSGNIKIPSLELNVDVRTQSQSFFDFGTTKKYNIKSEPKTVIIHSIPQNNRPATFSNAVGNFNISSKISQTQMKVGDSFTYTIIINGTGNLKQFDLPTVKAVNNLRFLDPEISTSINNNKISGKKTIKYLIIAQEKGNYTLPSESFSYFDTSSNTYKTLKTKPYNLNVGEGDLTYVASSGAQSIVNKEGSDIGFIITDSLLVSKKVYFNTFRYWFIWVIVLLFIPISVLYSKERSKLAGNIDYTRQKKANRILKKYMKEASKFASNDDQRFYAAAQLGLSSYLADKLKEPRGSSSDDILTELASKKFPVELIEQIKKLFETCDQARFMPGGFSQEKIELDFQHVKETINDIMKCKF